MGWKPMPLLALRSRFIPAPPAQRACQPKWSRVYCRSSMLRQVALAVLLSVMPLAAQAPAPSFVPANLGESEAQKIEEKISMVRRDALGKYEMSLGELQNQFQKAADLEGSLAVRAERTRVRTEQSLSEKDYLNDPKSL